MNRQKGSAIIILSFIIIASLAVIGTGVFLTNNRTSKNSVYIDKDQVDKGTTTKIDATSPVNQIKLENKQVTTSPVANADFITVFNLIKQANKEKNTTVYTQHATQKTKGMINSGFKPIWYSNMELLNIKEKNNDITATIKVTQENGRVEDMDILFIKESGVWKIAIAEQLERMAQSLQNTPPAVTSNSTGLPDFIVTDIKTYPNPPKVNNEKTQIEFFINNIGTAPSPKGVSFSLVIGDNSESNPTIGDPIAVGQTVSWVETPYRFEFQRDDQLGNKIIKVVLNNRHSIKESSEANNTYSQTVNFVN